MKKISYFLLSILLAVLLTACVPEEIPSVSTAVSLQPGVPTNTVSVSKPQPEKLICDVSIEERFNDHKLLIVVYPQWNYVIYTPDNFPSIGCVSVRELKAPKNDDLPTRVIQLTLDKNSKQNVLDCVKILAQREDVYCAQPHMEGEFGFIVNDVEYTGGN